MRSIAAPRMVDQLIRGQLLAMAMTWLALLGWLVVNMMALGDGELDRRMSTFARVLAETARGDSAVPAVRLLRLKAVEDAFVRGVIEDLDGAPHYRPHYRVRDLSGHLVAEGQPGDAQLLDALATSEGRRQNGQVWRFASAQSADGAITVQVAESLESRWTAVLPTLRIIGIGQLLIFLVCLIALRAAASRSLRGVRALAAQLREQEGHLSSSLPLEGLPAEIAVLVQALNDKIAAEQQRLSAQQAFIADAAHELRTPLAIIGAQAARVVSASTVASRAEAEAQLQRGIARVSHLARQLLTLAAVADHPLEMPSADAAEAIRLALAALAPAIEARRAALHFECAEPVRGGLADEEWATVVNNLVGNALQHGPEAVDIVVRLRVAATGLQFGVEDSGPGIPPTQRSKALHRFHRLQNGSGTGLGLPIVQAVVARRGGTLTLQDRPAGQPGLCVEIQLPGCRAATTEAAGP